MPINNYEIVANLNRLADLLEIEGANPFRVRAYRNAARTISNLTQRVSELIQSGADLTQLPGIGTDIANKITCLVETGELDALKEIEQRIPAVLCDLMKIEGLGPKRVQLLYKQLGIKTVEDLQQAIISGKLNKLAGFGDKIINKIQDGIKRYAGYEKRVKLADAIAIAKPLIEYLEQAPGLEKITIAGSYRRRKETVGDLDILVIAAKGSPIVNYFTRYSEVVEIISKGTTRSTVRLRSGLQVDLRVVPSLCYATALQYLTGSKAHNIALRNIAIRQGYKINEYGLFKQGKRISVDTETDIYHKLGLAYIEPELRENQGEIIAAKQNKLPRLIELKDIRGDLHCHTDASDGQASLEELAEAAIAHGYEYIAVTDHSKSLTVANGLSEKRLLAQIKAIDKLNEKMNRLVILKSIELDILKDGSLDLPDTILKELDLTVCSIHSEFNLPIQKQTERIIRAMDNKYFTILAHPSGRLINRRLPYEINFEQVMRAAKERNCFLELNAQPSRLDLTDIYCKMAKDMGVKVVISSDAHNIRHFNYMQYGIYQAKRGWLAAKDVLNTYPLSAFKKLIQR